MHSYEGCAPPTLPRRPSASRASGHVTANTDTASGVKDTVTTRTSSDLAPFRTATTAGTRIVIVSSASSARIDAKRPAVFSAIVISGMIRQDLGHSGVAIGDDLGDAERCRHRVPAPGRSLIAAGGDIVRTVDPSVVPAMIAAVTARAATDATFRSQVATAILRVLNAKASEGLLGNAARPHRDARTTDGSRLQRWLGRP